MKQNILSFFSLAFLLLCGVNVNAQCGDTTGSFCYDSGQTDAIQYSACPDAGETLNIEFTAGSIEANWDELYVYSGTNQDNTDTQINAPFTDGDLTGLTFSSANPGDCLTFAVTSDGSASCQTSQAEAQFVQSCDAIVLGCTDAGATNPTMGANFDDGSCAFAGDITHVTTGSQTETNCGPANFADSGGNAGNYASPESGTTTICPDDAATQVIEIVFNTFETENSWDGLFIYDADSADPAAQFQSGDDAVSGGLATGSFNGTNSPGTIMALNPTGCLTFFFDSDTSANFSGWNATYQCVARPMCADPSNGVAENVTFDSADLSWASNNTDDGDNTYSVYVGFPPADPTTGTGTTTTGLTEPFLAVTGLTESNTTYVFYIMENCGGADGDSDWSGPFFFTTEPNYCGGDQFTDDGGAAGNYSTNTVANGIAETVICPTGDPACDKVTVAFTEFELENNWDGLFIYDADSTDPAALINSGAPAGNGGLAAGSFTNMNSPGTITATNDTGCLTFFFDSDSSVTRPGFVADVVCGIPPVATNDQSALAADLCIDLANTPNIFDPCTCNIPTELLDGVVTTLGNFNEELDVLGVTPGATFDVTAGMGLNAPIGADGDAVVDVNANGILDAGDMITDANMDGDIQVTGTHDDGVGYEVTITDGIFVLTQGNLCNQPRPEVTDLSATYCTNGVPLTLEAIDALMSTEESVTFEIDGNTVTELDPAALGAGNFVLVVNFNGDNPPSSDTPETVGCPVVSSFSVSIVEGPTSLSCNDDVQVSVDDACAATITPDVVLEGADGCDESFSVSVMNNLGQNLGDVIDGSFVGETFTVRVTELSTGNFCWGSITVEDKIAPELDCPDVTLACTDIANPTSNAPANVTERFAIPANTATIAGDNDYLLEVNVPVGTSVVDVNIGILLLDNDLGNLDIQVTSPDGTNITVIPGPNGCAGIGGAFDFILDDDAAPAANLLCTGGSLQAGIPINDPFLGDPSVFEGGEASGTWTISINNLSDGGVNDILANVFLDIEFTSTIAAAVAVTATDNCTVNPILTFADITVTGDCGEASATTTRTYTATDASGNTAQCEQTITFERPTLADVTIPADVTIDCAVATDAATAATILGAGVPTINGQAIVNGSICNITSTLASEIIIADICPNTFKIRREWLVVDWCAADGTPNEILQVQYVKVLDSTGPAITGNNDQLAAVISSVSAGTDGAEHEICEGLVTLPALAWTDDCGTVEGYATSVLALDGSLIATVNTNGGTVQLPLYSTTSAQPEYTAVYSATDACGNTTTYTENFQTEDRVSPNCISDEITQVAIGADGIATVNASTFDDGSFDNCTDVHFLVDRQLFSTDMDAYAAFRFYEPSVEFTCADVGQNINVFFLVIDDFMWNQIQTTIELVGFFNFNASNLQQFQGHFNICMVNVLVEDKLAPFKIQDVVDSQIACDNYFNNFAPALDIADANGVLNPAVLVDAFGDVVYDDNCEAIVTVGYSRDVNSCGIGTITRTWSVVDASGNVGQSCTQTIDVFTVNDWGVTFPADQDAVCVAGQDELGGVNFGEPVVFDDDCELIAISIEDQLFNVVPDACYKVIRTYTAINWCVYDGDNDDDDIEFSSPLNSDGDARRFRDTNDGIIVYLQTIKVQDDIAPVLTNPGTQDYCIDGSTDADGDCDRSIELPEAVVSDCSDNITTTYSVAGLGTGRNYSNVAPGTYAVTVTSLDNCGNQSTITYDAIVRDCKAPTPYCVGGLVIELMPIDNNGDGIPDAGMVESWASDFNAGSFDNCTATEDLTVLASLSDEGVANATANIMFDCSHQGPTGVYLYIQDEAGNVDYCLTTVFIESVDNVCNANSPEIAGALVTENGATLATATVSLNNGTSTTSNANGIYSLMAEEGTDVTVIPEHDVYDNASVTTFDLLTIRQHILTTSLLDSPYKMIAADVNNNGNITASDLVAARQVILGMSTSYPNNNAWAFVDAAYVFPTNWTLSEGYPAVTNFNNIVTTETANFVAVRIGDVNGTYGFADSADERNSMIINANDATLVAGQEVTVEFSAADAVLGYQFTLNFENLEVVSIDGNEENFGVFANAITTSFDAKASDRLFSVTFQATADVTVSEAIALTSNITRAEAYSTNGAMNIALEFAGSKDADFALYQNTPNPFQGQTVIGFNLPTASAATLTITDISGKVLSITNGEYTTGYNEVRVSDLGATGVLYYQLDTQNNSAVRKMVVID